MRQGRWHAYVGIGGSGISISSLDQRFAERGLCYKGKGPRPRENADPQGDF